MPKLNPFRISFDGPLGSRERTRAKVAATVVGAAVLFLGATSVVALLNASSETINAWSNAKPVDDVRIVSSEGEDQSGKPCDLQTWPYIEARCLKQADQKSAERSTPKHGLAGQQVALPASKPTDAKAGPETTGSAGQANAPLERPLEKQVAPAPAAAPVASAPAATTPLVPASRPDARKSHSTREQARLDRERRAEARRAREQRARARYEARYEARRGRDRGMREWSDDDDDGPSSRSRRAIVTPRGYADDDFFRMMR